MKLKFLIPLIGIFLLGEEIKYWDKLSTAEQLCYASYQGIAIYGGIMSIAL